MDERLAVLLKVMGVESEEKNNVTVEPTSILDYQEDYLDSNNDDNNNSLNSNSSLDYDSSNSYLDSNNFSDSSDSSGITNLESNNFYEEQPECYESDDLPSESEYSTIDKNLDNVNLDSSVDGGIYLSNDDSGNNSTDTLENYSQTEKPIVNNLDCSVVSENNVISSNSNQELSEKNSDNSSQHNSSDTEVSSQEFDTNYAQTSDIQDVEYDKLYEKSEYDYDASEQILTSMQLAKETTKNLLEEVGVQLNVPLEQSLEEHKSPELLEYESPVSKTDREILVKEMLSKRIKVNNQKLSEGLYDISFSARPTLKVPNISAQLDFEDDTTEEVTPEPDKKSSGIFSKIFNKHRKG